MKIASGLVIFVFLFPALLLSQEYIRDNRIQLLREDGLNYYQSETISELDLLQGLELAGIKISKYKLGEFDKKYRLSIFIEEYVKSKVVKTDTVYCDNNEYMYFAVGDNKPRRDYINQIKIITKEDSNKILFHFNTYRTEFNREFKIQKNEPGQFYMLRKYLNTMWVLNKKIPLMIYASSWNDGSGQRFCGIVNLLEGEQMTNELLLNSPKYILVSYKITDIN